MSVAVHAGQLMERLRSKRVAQTLATQDDGRDEPSGTAVEREHHDVGSGERLCVVATRPSAREGSFLLFSMQERLAPAGLLVALALALAAMGSSACGDDDGAASAADSGALSSDGALADSTAVREAGPSPVLGQIRATLTHAGAFDGTLRVGAFRENPPEAPPFAHERVTMPSFPVTVELDGLEPGIYFVVGALDTAPPSPTIPGEEDTTGASEAVVVEGDELHEITLEIR